MIHVPLGASCQLFIIRNYLKTLNSCNIIFPKVDFLGFWICFSPLNPAQNNYTKYHFFSGYLPFFAFNYVYHTTCMLHIAMASYSIKVKPATRLNGCKCIKACIFLDAISIKYSGPSQIRPLWDRRVFRVLKCSDLRNMSA